MPKIVNSLLVPTAPNLPAAPKTYDGRYVDQLLNVFRLYFNRIGGNAVGSLLGPLGGQHLNTPFGSFYDTTDQYDGSTTIPYAVRFNTTAIGQGVSIVPRDFVGTGSIALTVLTITAVTSGRMYPANLLSGTGVTAGTYSYLQLSSTATPVVGTQTFVSGGVIGTNTFVVSGGAGSIETRQFVSGTGVPVNTRVLTAAYDSVTGNTTVTLNANFTVQASGNYVFRPWGYEGTYSVSPSQTVASTQISATLPSLITPTYPGIYNVQFSFQFTNTDTQIHDIDIWLKKNDVDIPDSNSQFSVPNKHGGVDGHLIAALNFAVEMEAGDVLEIVWHTSDSHIFMETIDPQTNPIRPRTPSAIVTVTFVSTLTTA